MRRETKISDWKGYEKISFEVDGRESYFVMPKNPRKDRAWVWRTEFFGAFACADIALLERGWILAYHCVSNLYGCPQSIDKMDAFYRVATEEFGLSPKPSLFGFSRGALYAVNFADRFPDRASSLYLDAPVTDLRSWPGNLDGNCVPCDSCKKECMALYNIPDDAAFASFEQSPNAAAERIAKARIPVIIVAGDSDTTVPFEKNGAIFAERFRRAAPKTPLNVIVKPGCDHHPHSLDDPTPIVGFVEKHARKK